MRNLELILGLPSAPLEALCFVAAAPSRTFPLCTLRPRPRPSRHTPPPASPSLVLSSDPRLAPVHTSMGWVAQRPHGRTWPLLSQFVVSSAQVHGLPCPNSGLRCPNSALHRSQFIICTAPICGLPCPNFGLRWPSSVPSSRGGGLWSVPIPVLVPVPLPSVPVPLPSIPVPVPTRTVPPWAVEADSPLSLPSAP